MNDICENCELAGDCSPNSLECAALVRMKVLECWHGDVMAALPNNDDRKAAETIYDLRGKLTTAVAREDEEREGRKKAERTTAFTQQWYAERWARLHQWAKDHDAPELFSIMANGTADAFEPPTYAQQLNLAKHRAEEAQRALQAHQADLEAAAGELLVPTPEPGTDMAKLLSANVLLRHRLGDLWLAVEDIFAAKCAAKCPTASGVCAEGFPCDVADLYHQLRARRNMDTLRCVFSATRETLDATLQRADLVLENCSPEPDYGEIRRRMVEQRCAEAGLDSLEAWARERPGEHIWTPYADYEACAVCGSVRRGDGNNKPCKGIARLTLRDSDEADR